MDRQDDFLADTSINADSKESSWQELRSNDASANANLPPMGLAKRFVYPLAGHLIVVALILCAFLSWKSLHLFLTNVDNDYSVVADGIERIALTSGPTAFLIQGNQLKYRGSIDDKTKQALLALFPKTTSTDAAAKNDCGLVQNGPLTCAEIEKIYRQAIDKLAYLSNADRSDLLLSLLLTGACFGALGSAVRSVSAYVNHRSHARLDLDNWSPYYYARPFNGAVFGVVVVIIVKAGFLTANHTDADATLWWISLAFFAGFADREFGEKVRQISLALFGESRDKPGSDKEKQSSPSA